MASLYVTNFFELLTNGQVLRGKQGTATDSPFVPFAVSVSGLAHIVPGLLSVNSVVTLWDDDDDVPADFDYLFWWADQITYLQLIGPAMNVTFKVAAKVPFVLPGFDTFRAAADATAITGGTEPTLSDIDSVIAGNYTETEANYFFAVVD